MTDKLKVLEMLQDGTITVDEASKLLEAVQAETALGPTVADALLQPTDPTPVPPDMQRFRRLSYIPFGISVLFLLLTGWGTLVVYQRTGGRITFGFVVLTTLVLLALLATALTLAMTVAPWLHVRISSESGGKPTRFAISLPAPLGLASWALRIAHRFVDEEQAAYLSAAAGVLASVRHEMGKPGIDPIVVDIDDEDERVQVYIG
jgi:hypothetical protein